MLRPAPAARSRWHALPRDGGAGAGPRGWRTSAYREPARTAASKPAAKAVTSFSQASSATTARSRAERRPRRWARQPGTTVAAVSIAAARRPGGSAAGPRPRRPGGGAPRSATGASGDAGAHRSTPVGPASWPRRAKSRAATSGATGGAVPRGPRGCRPPAAHQRAEHRRAVPRAGAASTPECCAPTPPDSAAARRGSGDDLGGRDGPRRSAGGHHGPRPSRSASREQRPSGRIESTRGVGRGGAALDPLRAARCGRASPARARAGVADRAAPAERRRWLRRGWRRVEELDPWGPLPGRPPIARERAAWHGTLAPFASRCINLALDYGSRPRQRSEVNAAPPSSSRPAAAKPALTSRFSFLVPIREPSVS